MYDTNQNHIGTVGEVIETGANAVLRVSGEKEYLIPYVKAFITEFYAKEKRIIVNMVEVL